VLRTQHVVSVRESWQEWWEDDEVGKPIPGPPLGPPPNELLLASTAAGSSIGCGDPLTEAHVVVVVAVSGVTLRCVSCHGAELQFAVFRVSGVDLRLSVHGCVWVCGCFVPASGVNLRCVYCR
jgi:hypothetical protein